MFDLLRKSLPAILLATSLPSIAQFTITETFRGSTSLGVTLGGDAMLTSGTQDPAGDGWLRLTPSSTVKLGYGYVTSSFPSALGVLVDFEYTAWRTTGTGADGFSVYLFDATTPTFKIGGTGGSLGYAQNNGVPANTGLSGGYIGIGVDEFGNWSSTVNGKSGGPGSRPNAVAVRGPAPNYSYISGHQIIASDAGAGDNGGVDYNSTIASRPTQAQFYRRLQFEIVPGSGTRTLTVRWKTALNGAFVTLFGPVNLAAAPPALLKVGFAASTGAFINTHEIRNVLITTPGNIHVTKSAPLSKTVSSYPTNIPYRIVVANGTAGTVTGITFNDLLPPGYTVTLGDITTSNNGNATNTVSNLSVAGASITADLTIAANSEISFDINGSISSAPPGGQMVNSVTVGSGNITESDLTNNTASFTTQILLALPITLKEFTLKKTEDAIQLNWSTTQEENFSHTAIERSTNGQDFSLLKTVPTQAGGNIDKEYIYQDENAPVGQLYYRLKLVDLNGAFKYSMIRSVNNTGNNSWQLIPNPANTQTIVNLPDQWHQGVTSWKLVDMLGKQVGAGSGRSVNQLQVPVKGLPTGRYTILLSQQERGLRKTLSLQVNR